MNKRWDDEDRAKALIRYRNRQKAGRVGEIVPVESITRHQARDAVRTGTCPWCKETFRLLGVHTARAHGVTAKELKMWAVVPVSTPLCDPQLSDRWREAAEQSGALAANHGHGAEIARRYAAENHPQPELSTLQRQRYATLSDLMSLSEDELLTLRRMIDELAAQT